MSTPMIQEGYFWKLDKELGKRLGPTFIETGLHEKQPGHPFVIMKIYKNRSTGNVELVIGFTCSTKFGRHLKAIPIDHVIRETGKTQSTCKFCRFHDRPRSLGLKSGSFLLHSHLTTNYVGIVSPSDLHPWDGNPQVAILNDESMSRLWNDPEIGPKLIDADRKARHRLYGTIRNITPGATNLLLTSPDISEFSISPSVDAESSVWSFDSSSTSDDNDNFNTVQVYGPSRSETAIVPDTPNQRQGVRRLFVRSRSALTGSYSMIITTLRIPNIKRPNTW